MTRDKFHEIWETIIRKRCELLKSTYGGLLLAENAEEEIYTYYQEICGYVHRHYMKEPEERVNRYKIGGMLIIAILKTKPLKKADEKFYKATATAWAFNESVALYTALAVIRTFIVYDAKKEPTKGNQFRRELFKGIPITEARRKNWEVELYHLRQEGCYNVLSLAHELEDFVEKTVLMALLKQLKPAAE